MAQGIVVLDNGGGSCKVGFSGQSQPAGVWPNCTARVKGERQLYVGDLLLDCQDVSSISIRRPVDRGFVVNWDVQKEVWSRAFNNLLQINPMDHGLLLTEPLFNLPAIQETSQQVVFEEYGFASFCTVPAPAMSLWHHRQRQPQLQANMAGCGLVVDAGFSSTSAVPVFDGQVLHQGVRRINLGGKVLTNYLKELVSYRSINMMEETYLVELVKETVCFVSQDLRADLAIAAQPGHRSLHRLEYVLPDGVINMRGYVRAPAAPAASQDRASLAAERKEAASSKEAVLALNNERFMVPELLFHPSDIGLDQAGLPKTIVQAVSATHPSLHALLYSNILLTGGTARCPGFMSRLRNELRALVPDEFDVGVQLPEDPVLAAWQGAADWAASPAYASLAVSRADYEEHGPYRLSI